VNAHEELFEQCDEIGTQNRPPQVSLAASDDCGVGLDRYREGEDRREILINPKEDPPCGCEDPAQDEDETMEERRSDAEA